MISYTCYLQEPKSRNLDRKVDPRAAEEAHLRDLHRINYLMHSLIEDLEDLLPAGWEVTISEAEHE